MEGNEESQAIIRMLVSSNSQLKAKLSLSSSSSCTPPRGRGRGRMTTTNTPGTVSKDNFRQPQLISRGRGFGKLLQNVNRYEEISKTTSSNIMVDKMPSFVELAYVSPKPTKSVVCNAVPVESNHVFEYTPHFKPDIDVIRLRFTYLNKHFKNIARKFLYNGLSLYVPSRLLDSEVESGYCSRVTNELVTLKLEFKQKINLESCPKLLHVLCKHVFNSLQETNLQASKQNMISNYVTAVRNTKNETLLCVDSQRYNVQAKNIAEVMLEFEERYRERFREAVNELLIKTFVYCVTDCKIYKLVGVIWKTRLLELETNGHQRTADPKDCIGAEIISDYLETPKKLISDLEELFSSQMLENDWNVRLGAFVKAKARVLEPETIIFGDAVECTPQNGNWEESMRNNKFLISAELCFWVIFHMKKNMTQAKDLANHIQRLGDNAGMSIGKPLFFEITSDSKKGYIDALRHVLDQKLQLVVVITPESANKPHALIKHICCICKPMPCQIVASSDVMNPLKAHEIIMQLSVMLGGIPWTVKFPYENWMVCGVDLCCAFQKEALPVCSFVTALTSDATQWYSKAMLVTGDFTNCFQIWILDILKKYKDTNGIYPSQLVIYQNCTEESRTQLTKNYNRIDFNKCFQQLKVKNVEICVVFVRKDTRMSYYKDLKSGVSNVPPGTVVDNTITDANTHNFFLNSCYASDCMIARPTHYEVIKNSSLTPEQVQMLTYKMCHLYYKRARTVEVPAPCLYAQQLSILVARDIHEIPLDVLNECLYYM